jgi:hypothetical protein
MLQARLKTYTNAGGTEGAPRSRAPVVNTGRVRPYSYRDDAGRRAVVCCCVLAVPSYVAFHWFPALRAAEGPPHARQQHSGSWGRRRRRQHAREASPAIIVLRW